MNATLDIGNNLTALISQLAMQIGTTTEQIFPLYVRQQIIEGWSMIGMLLLSAAISAFLIIRFFKKANFCTGEGMPPVVCGIILAIATGLSAVPVVPISLGKILNPQYGAMKTLAHDIGTMTGKQR